jgi:hypothetical protein
MVILVYKRRKMSAYIYKGYLLSSLFGCKNEKIRQIQKTQSPSPFPLWNVDNHRGKKEGLGTQKQAERKNQGNPNTYNGVVRVLVAMPRLRNKGAPPPWPVVACKPSLRPHLLQSSNLFTVSEFLTIEECQGFIKAAEARGLEHQGSLGPAMGEAFRDNERLAVSDPCLAQKLWNAGLEKLLKDITIEGKLPVGLNPNIRFYRYKEGQRFGPHYDESVHLDDGCSTEYTLLVYLSGGVGANEATASHTVMADQPLVGGETVFYSSRKRIVAQVTPIAGMALFHVHGDRCLLHEAKVVSRGVKYILRSDVIFA